MTIRYPRDHVMLPVWQQPLYNRHGHFITACYVPHRPGARLPGSLEIQEGRSFRCVPQAFQVIGESTLADYLCEGWLAGGSVGKQWDG